MTSSPRLRAARSYPKRAITLVCRLAAGVVDAIVFDGAGPEFERCRIVAIHPRADVVERQAVALRRDLKRALHHGGKTRSAGRFLRCHTAQYDRTRCRGESARLALELGSQKRGTRYETNAPYTDDACRVRGFGRTRHRIRLLRWISGGLSRRLLRRKGRLLRRVSERLPWIELRAERLSSWLCARVWRRRGGCEAKSVDD
jgi:hypothetical protein